MKPRHFTSKVPAEMAAAELLQRKAAEFQTAVLDALPANIALIDSVGAILSVNRSWREFGVSNALSVTDSCVGHNYLKVCDGVEGESIGDARATAAGIRNVLAGARPSFTLEYPCHSPTQQRWYRLMVTPVQFGNASGAVVMHINVTDRMKAEMALRTSESSLAAAQKIAHLGSWELDLATNRVLWSAEMCRLFYRDPAQGSPSAEEFERLVHPEDLLRVREVGVRLGGVTDPLAIHYRTHPSIGPVRDILANVRVLRDESGVAFSVTGTALDVTERMRVEALLRAQEGQQRELAIKLETERAKLADAQAIAKLGSWETDLATLSVSWSEQTHRIFGTDPATFEPSHEGFIELVHPDDRAAVRAAFVGSLSSPEVFSLEHRIRLATGQVKVVEERWQTFMDERGRAVRTVGTCWDITTRKEAEDKVRSGEALVRMAGRLSLIGAWSVDLASGRATWSEQTCLIHGMPAGHQLTLEEVVAHYRPEDQTVFRREFDACARGGQNFDLELSLGTFGNDCVHVRVIGEAVCSGSGDITTVQGAIQDITERKRAELDSRRASESLRGVVAALQEITVSHRPLDEMLTHVAERARMLTEAKGGLVEFVEGKELVYRAVAGAASDNKGLRLPRSGSLSGLALQTGIALVSDDTETDARVDRQLCRRVGVRSMVVVPLRDGARAIGVLKVFSDQPSAFSARDVANLQILAESLGAVIERERATEQLRESETQYRILFSSNPHPMWVFDTKTLQFLAVNKAAVEHYGYSQDEFLRMTIRDIRPPAEFDRLMATLTGGIVQQKNLGIWRHRTKSGALIDVEVSADAAELNGRAARLVLAHDVTERLRGERELARKTRALTMLSRGREAMIRAQSEKDLLEEICRVATEVGGYRMAWVGYALHDENRTIQPQAAAGGGEDYLASLKLSWAEDRPGGQGPSGRAVRSGEPVVILDLEQDHSFVPWRTAAVSQGFRGIVSLPLSDQATPLGVMVFYLAEVRELLPDELTLMQELADNLAFGIVTLRTRAERRRTHDALIVLARGTSASTGTEFFEQLARSLIEALGAQFGAIARYVGPDRLKARALAAAAAGQSVANFEYELKGSACELLRDEEVLIVSRDFKRRFPSARTLTDRSYEAYIGCMLRGSSGKPIGLIFVQFEQPVEEPDFIASTLRIAASRAAAEIERMDAEAQTREQASLLDKSQDAIFVRNLEHKITFWNQSAQRIYGWSAEEAIGSSARTLLYREQTIFDSAMSQLLAHGEWLGELAQVRKDSRPIVVEARWALVRDDHGRPKEILVIATDITERKKLEQQFLRSQRIESIGTLAGGIAHDLNNLLAPITMGVDLLKRLEPSPKSQQIIETMERSARRGADLVKQVLSFSRGVEGARVPLDVRHVIREVDAIVLSTFPKNITLEISVPRQLWLVTADPTQISQVLLNLCVNARDAMADGGVITVEAINIEIDAQYAVMNGKMTPGRYVRIQVTDTGCGMPQEVVDRIFEPFFTTKEFGKGTGLGLSTVMGIVRSHSGLVNVYSELGKGSSFKVYLPASSSDGGTASEPSLPARTFPKGNGELILLVDDEAPILKVASETLKHAGYRVVTAADGAEAVAQYATHRGEIALVMTDMMMPVMDGPSLIVALRRIEPNVVIIAASGIAANGAVAQVSGSGVRHFLAKPYSADAMLTLIHQLLTDGESRAPFGSKNQ